jgi:hypothetical protein
MNAAKYGDRRKSRMSLSLIRLRLLSAFARLVVAEAVG